MIKNTKYALHYERISQAEHWKIYSIFFNYNLLLTSRKNKKDKKVKLFFTVKGFQKRSMAVKNFFYFLRSQSPHKQEKKDKKVKLRHFFWREELKNICVCLCYSSFIPRFIKMKSRIQRELCTSRLYQKPLRRCQSSARGWWEFILVKDSGGGYAAVRSSFRVVNGKWGTRR